MWEKGSKKCIKKVAVTYVCFSEGAELYKHAHDWCCVDLSKRFAAGFVQQRKREKCFTMVYFVIRTWGDLFGKSA
jgi:hypothetical protein